MRTSVLDETPVRPPAPGPTRPRRRPLSLLSAGMLVLLAIGVGASIALASQPARSPATTSLARPSEPAPEQSGQAATPATEAARSSTAPQPSGQAQPATAPTTSTPTAGQAAVLPDGRHHAFVRKVNARRSTITVDLVQLFRGEAAVKAAIEDGKPSDEAQYLDHYVRNQNGRLRTLPMARGVGVHLLATCEESSPTQAALLAKLAENAGLGDVYYYTLTVRGGAVRQIQEHLTTPAC